MSARARTYRRVVPAAATTIAVTAALAACGASGEGAPVDTETDKPFVISGVENVTQVAQLTGPDSTLNDTDAVAVAGTDLGSMINVGDRTYFLFGDTFGVREPGMTGGGGGNWRSNAMAYTTDDDPTDGITFDGWITDDIGLALELVPGLKEPDDTGEVTKIPTYGFAIEDTLYLSFMSVRHWGDPGVWTANYSALARSTDEGQSWEVLDDVQWPGDSNFIQVATAQVVEDGTEYVYQWGIPAGRFGGVQLMRVEATTDAVEDLGAYEYFTGTDDDGAPVWSEDLDEAETVLDGTIGELSVMYHEQTERWLLTTSTGGDAVLFEGATPWGPWSEPHTITTQAETPGLYSPYLNPRYVSEDGSTLYFTLSIWDPYNVFWYAMDLVTES
ncbi:carbohydrate-binding protein [Beutenbergia cavernae DSM 12333]|uniref:Carbohydrate-binding protein n=1 Tax=Beutenbergia cavernae (strain ATCC BAA-8 / DSM 12333 / CCUG 43141 / JCM 11478 / NBRC 16432 / NCIMB 13614 / HKI 0122) TaxID=471853 RepID=C5C450_BEUC1|nr:DUF4185 domain-containing protein [Beutenbergia cavernae]ACQ79963.1 carbohydrate-binding protein [Beutenbergia cavernae DSM 12333]